MSRKPTLVIPVLFVFVLSLGLSPARAASEDVLLRAMKDELVRSLEKLRLEELDKPYFIAYRVDETKSLSASASLGSLLTSGDGHSRTLHVELRVGGYEFDNTNFLGTPSFSTSRMVRAFGGMSQLPLDDDYREIRRQIWLGTDAAYKQAVEDLAKKQAALKNKTRTEDLPDFSREEAVEIHDDRPPASAEVGDLEELATSISALFRAMPAVYTSKVDASVTNTRTLYVNSEGTSYTRTRPRVRFSAVAATQAADGMLLEDFVAAYGRDPADLPPREELAKRVGELGARLAALRDAELLDRYNGPVLFEGQAAAELFAQVLAPELIAQRRPVVGDERMARMAERNAGAEFEDRLGARVLPRFLSVTDDPTRAELDGTRLQATYKVDDDGVPAGTTAVIQRGYLKTLLNGRAWPERRGAARRAAAAGEGPRGRVRDSDPPAGQPPAQGHRRSVRPPAVALLRRRRSADGDRVGGRGLQGLSRRPRGSAAQRRGVGSHRRDLQGDRGRRRRARGHEPALHPARDRSLPAVLHARLRRRVGGGVDGGAKPAVRGAGPEEAFGGDPQAAGGGAADILGLGASIPPARGSTLFGESLAQRSAGVEGRWGRQKSVICSVCLAP